MKKLLHTLGSAIFWLWNLTFLLVVYAGILPFIGVQLVSAVFTGEIESEFLIPFLGLIAVPTVCTLIGWWSLRKRPLELMRLFYGVEAPLFGICLVRLFVLRELTPASTLLLGTVVACIVAFLLEVLHGYAERRRAVAWLQMTAHSLMLLVGIYVGVLLLFYAVPAAAVLVREFFTFRWVEALWWMFTYDTLAAIWWVPVSFILFGFSSTLFLGMPSALAALYIQSGHRILQRFAAQYGQKRTLQGALAVLSVWMILVISFQQQPQVKAFQLLENPLPTDSARTELLGKSKVIRKGLLNAYLSSYRYLSPIEENDHIYAMYGRVFDLPKPLCEFLQDSYNQLMSPFLYNGSRSDSEKAEKLYAEFFDAPIQKAERKAVQRALQSTAIVDEAKAGVLNINQKKVWLRSQHVTLQENGDWADVELYEVYENQTRDVEEILYYFSLPESAAITGVWLGDTDNRETRFPFKVSPRGAAQKVYNSQVKRERPVDPALLEQVGPRLYRLRAFPVPPKLSSWERTNSTERPGQMHLWLTYKVMRQEEGWALPGLGEKRNIFWTKDTKRIRDGKVVAGAQDDWLPPFLPATGQQQPTLHQINFPNGYRLTAKPLTEKDYSLPEGKRFAVVLDSSHSMAEHTKELVETFNWLKKHGFADNSFANNDTDLYVTASAGAQPKRIDDIRRFDAAKMTFYGTLQHKEMLRQFVQLQGDTPYDGILLITDEGSYELSDDKKDVPKMPAPLWMVHLGALPPAYDDATLKAIQDSSGGVSTELPEVLQRLATQTTLKLSVVSVVDGYAWSMEKVETGNTASIQEKETASKGFEPVAARQLVTGLSKKIEGNQLAQLDAIHAVAKTYEIVTPYSSMIVLVNDEQREALKQAEAEKDRFERKVENGKERLTQPNNPLSVSVPEPGMLVGLVAIALFLMVSRQRRTINSIISADFSKERDN
jgi:putative PEP-CTERM system integral membrane protein